jgi:deoxyribose-phosphate aldolase
MDAKKFAAHLDATNLKLNATDAEICALCDEAAHAEYASVCIYPESVSVCSNILYSTPVHVCTVIGFPHGRSTVDSMCAEIRKVKDNGADEVDIVINYASLRAGDRNYVTEQMQAVCSVAKELNLLSKIIVETCFLTRAQKLSALKICESAGANFIKTSTGFGTAGASVEDVQLFRDHRAADIQIKASGGIKTFTDAKALIEAGATRLGVSAANSLIAELNGATPTTSSDSSY